MKRLLTHLTLAVLATVAISTAAPARTQDNANAQTPEEELATLTAAAEAGDAEAMYELAYYWESYEFEYDKAFEWYMRGAEAGHPEAQYSAGFYYRTGFLGLVRQDFAEAVKWFHKSAAQGNASARQELGDYYSSELASSVNWGVSARPWFVANKEISWYRAGVAQGDADAQFALGWCYYSGHKVKTSYTEAVRLFRLSAEQGNLLAKFALYLCYAEGQGVQPNRTEAEKWRTEAFAASGKALAGVSFGQKRFVFGTGNDIKYGPTGGAYVYDNETESGIMRLNGEGTFRFTIMDGSGDGWLLMTINELPNADTGHWEIDYPE